jgi:hypothetical protein
VQEDSNISLGQKIFVESILTWLHMEKSYSAATPLDKKVKLDLAESYDEKINSKEYQTTLAL